MNRLLFETDFYFSVPLFIVLFDHVLVRKPIFWSAINLLMLRSNIDSTLSLTFTLNILHLYREYNAHPFLDFSVTSAEILLLSSTTAAKKRKRGTSKIIQSYQRLTMSCIFKIAHCGDCDMIWVIAVEMHIVPNLQFVVFVEYSPSSSVPPMHLILTF